MNANEARAISNQNGREEWIKQAIKSVEDKIIEKAKQGKNSFCFGITDGEQTYRIKINGEYKSIALPEVREHFKAKGFTFKPTGVINGVYQMTEDICW